jgi:hypothetical protein
MDYFKGIVVASVSSALVACAGSTSSPVTDATDGGSHVDAEANATACATLAAADCAVLARCSPNGTSIDYGSAATCATREALSCNAALTAKGTSRTPAQDVTCAAAVPGDSCTTYLDGIQPSACNALPGSGATGSACTFSAQCSSAYCAIPTAGECGTCQAVPAPGTSCANLDGCGPALACYHSTCVAYVASGGTCSATDPCTAGLSCVIAKGSSTGSCMEQGTTVGAACDPTEETAASCDATQELYCVHLKGDPNLHTCQKSPLATAGQACGDVAGVTSLCSSESVCYKTTIDAGTTGTCIARAADGAKCDTVTGPPCLAPARCIGTLLDGGASGVCTLPGTTTCP